MPNLFSMFRELIPSEPLQVGTVTSSDGDTHLVTLLDGTRKVVRGKAGPNDNVFIKGDMIQSSAPALTLETIEV